MEERSAADNRVIVLGPHEGRSYPCGSMQAIFKADDDETGSRYSVSEWWLEPNGRGVGAHSHEANEELFYVLEGMVTFLVGDRHVDATAGTFLRIPAKVVHGFENRTQARAGILNVFMPGGFEELMPNIVQWFAEHPEGA